MGGGWRRSPSRACAVLVAQGRRETMLGERRSPSRAGFAASGMNT